MYNYSIMPLDPLHTEAVCEDIRSQYEQGVTNCALFCMTLVPEGNPTIPKAEILCETFDRYYEILHGWDIPCGMLMQASIGHGYVLDDPNPFQRLVNFSDGAETNTVCPYDEGFRAYIRHTMTVMASHHPDVIMVDDDFRLIDARAGQGCFCPLHRRALAKRLQMHQVHTDDAAVTDRAALWERVHRDDRAGRELRGHFIETQLDALRGAARAMREGIDAVDKTIPGMFCCVGPDCEAAADIASILAGEGNPVIIRINNGNYTPAGARYLTGPMFRAATQMAVLKKQRHVDAFLAETDTCPQNRYSTGAQSLHAHFTGTILEGASGAKHWITRLHAFEPESGRAYRRILAKNAGFYETLSSLVPRLEWTGCCVPVTDEPDYGYTAGDTGGAWALHVLERLGLPLFFAPLSACIERADHPKTAFFIDGGADARYTDEALAAMFSHTVFTDGTAAGRLSERGLSRLTGVYASPWDGDVLSGELLPGGNECNAQVGAMRLEPLSDTVSVDSRNFHREGGKERRMVSPAVTVFENACGGTAVTFCGAVRTAFQYTQAFSFLNESRKRQLVDLMRRYGDLPVYYRGDEEVYFRAAYIKDRPGMLFCAVFNIGLDPIEEIVLETARPVHGVQLLNPGGAWVDVPFFMDEDAGILTIAAPAYTLNPTMLLLQ
ncbi:MAG: hypothetical protein ACI3XM_01320 [Eubacteriales bacterium]